MKLVERQRFASKWDLAVFGNVNGFDLERANVSVWVLRHNKKLSGPVVNFEIASPFR
jgi:hypothetical protein